MEHGDWLFPGEGVMVRDLLTLAEAKVRAAAFQALFGVEPWVYFKARCVPPDAERPRGECWWPRGWMKVVHVGHRWVRVRHSGNEEADIDPALCEDTEWAFVLPEEYRACRNAGR